MSWNIEADLPQLTPLTTLKPPSQGGVGEMYITKSSPADGHSGASSPISPFLQEPSKSYAGSSDGENESGSRASSPEPIGSLRIDKGHSRPGLNEGTPSTPHDSSRLRPPTLNLPPKSMDERLDEKINNILTSLPSEVRLTAQNLKKLNEASVKKNLSFGKGIDPNSVTHIPGPRSVVSNVSSSSSTPYGKGTRTYSGQFNNSSQFNNSETKLYHLHRGEGQTPIKLFVRLVGASGERVMVRIGGGWADLAEYLKEYALHHGSGRRAVSHTFEVQDLTNAAEPTSKLQPPTNVSLHQSSVRSASSMGQRTPSSSIAGSRPSSPLPPPTGPKGTAPSLQPPSGPRGSTAPKTMRGGHNGNLSRPTSSLDVRRNDMPTRPGSSLGGAMAKSIPPPQPGSSLGIPKGPPTGPKGAPTGPARPGSSLGGNLKAPPTGPARPGSSLGGTIPKAATTGPKAPPTGPRGTPTSAMGGSLPKSTPTEPATSESTTRGALPKPTPTGPISSGPASSEPPPSGNPKSTEARATPPPKAPAATGLMASKYASAPPSTPSVRPPPLGPSFRGPQAGPRTPIATSTGPAPRISSRPPSSQGNYQNTPPPLRSPSSHRTIGSRPPSSSGLDAPRGPGARPASRLSFGADGSGPGGPLGLAGPNAKAMEIAPEQQAWVDGMLVQVRKVSAQRTPPQGPAVGSAVGDEEEEEGVGRQQMQMHRSRFGYNNGGGPGGNTPTGPGAGNHGPGGAPIGDMGKAGNTRRVFLNRSSFGGAGSHGHSHHGYQGQGQQ